MLRGNYYIEFIWHGSHLGIFYILADQTRHRKFKTAPGKQHSCQTVVSHWGKKSASDDI